MQVYYPVRHQLLVHMVNSVQRLAFSTNGTPEQKKLAVDLAEVIIRWEIVRKEDEVSVIVSAPQWCQSLSDGCHCHVFSHFSVLGGYLSTLYTIM